jgi:DNA-binding FadR family transcriptional regulator
MANLKSIQKKSLVDVVEEKLWDYLSKSDFNKGDSLPKETEIAKQLDVSRNIVREALSRLRMLGLIESKKKKGMTLSEPQLFKGFEKIAEPKFLSLEKIKELIEFRFILEMGLPNLLYRHKDKIDFDELESVARKYQQAETQEERIKYDSKFHGLLYKASGNKTLTRFITLLDPILEFQARNEKQIDSPMPHQEMVQILKNGTKDEFCSAMEKHLKNKINQLEELKT